VVEGSWSTPDHQQPARGWTAVNFLGLKKSHILGLKITILEFFFGKKVFGLFL
jgi:hypothetical protein